MNNLIAIYLIIGIVFALYLLLCHLHATWKYVKQLYTAKKVEPTKIKTYFGFRYWVFSNNDSWIEVIGMSTLFSCVWFLVAFLGWPVSILLVLNKSIQAARDRIENGE